MKLIIFLAIFFIGATNDCSAQGWMKLVPLESSREEVEKILGVPERSFPSYAAYRAGTGRFHVWYSTGECRKGVEGLQYKAPADSMTGLIVSFDEAPSIESVIPDRSEYTRKENHHRTGYLYTSKDESIVYETYGRAERVRSIEIRPGKGKERFICKSGDMK